MSDVWLCVWHEKWRANKILHLISQIKSHKERQDTFYESGNSKASFDKHVLNQAVTFYPKPSSSDSFKFRCTFSVIETGSSNMLAWFSFSGLSDVIYVLFICYLNLWWGCPTRNENAM